MLMRDDMAQLKRARLKDAINRGYAMTYRGAGSSLSRTMIRSTPFSPICEAHGPAQLQALAVCQI
jgi:hypothetical protein